MLKEFTPGIRNVGRREIQFIQAREVLTTKLTETDILYTTSEWDMRTDIIKRLVLPDLVKTIRSEFWLWSMDNRMNMTELKVPSENG